MTFWGNKKWIIANSDREIVSGFSAEFLSDGCYKLSIGEEAVISPGYAEKEDSYRILTKGKTLSLQPGQFAYLITGESIYMPVGTLTTCQLLRHSRVAGRAAVFGAGWRCAAGRG